MVFRNGEMGQSMKDIGRMIKLMVMGPFIRYTVMYIRESGKMIWFMALANTIILTEHVTKATGNLMSNTDSVRKSGLMALNMKATIIKVKNTAEEHILGLMVLNFLVIG